jgi:uncharacterized protein (TIGR02186 family)
MRRLCVALIAALLVPAAVAQEDARTERPRAQIAAGLAEETVQVKVNYSGARIVLFATSPAAEDPDTGFAVALIGPPRRETVVRRTVRGEERFNFVHAPSVFAVGTEPIVAQTVTPEVMIESGLNAAASAMPPANKLMSPDLEEWRSNLVDLKMQDGLYRLDDTTIDKLDGGLRRARIILPANAPPGEYKVRAVAFRNGQRIGETTQTLTLVRSGLDATLFDLSRSHGFVYGFLAVLAGCLVGGLAAWIGRR